MVKFSKKRNSQKRKVVTKRNTKKRNTKNKKNSKRGGGNAVVPAPTQDDYNDFFRFLVCAIQKPEILELNFLRTNHTLRECNQKITSVIKHFPKLKERQQFLDLFKHYKKKTYVVVGDNIHYNHGEVFGFGNEDNVTKQKIKIISVKLLAPLGFENEEMGTNTYSFYSPKNDYMNKEFSYEDAEALFKYFRERYEKDAINTGIIKND